MAEKRGSFISKAAAFIVDKRNVFFLLYAFAFLFCIFSMGWVNVENDVTKYLPEDAEIRQGYDAMSAYFTVTGMGRSWCPTSPMRQQNRSMRRCPK